MNGCVVRRERQVLSSTAALNGSKNPLSIRRSGRIMLVYTPLYVLHDQRKGITYYSHFADQHLDLELAGFRRSLQSNAHWKLTTPSIRVLESYLELLPTGWVVAS